MQLAWFTYLVLQKMHKDGEVCRTGVYTIYFSQIILAIFGEILSLTYSGVHKRSDAYSSVLSKPQIFSMAWRTFEMLLPTWQSGSKQILI